jgi:hypothetical protein
MTRIVVRVDGAGPSKVAVSDRALDLRTQGDGRNVLIDPDQIARTFLAEVPPRARDLLYIAGAIYAADARSDRGKLTDAFNDAWTRDFVFHVGVHDLPFWSRPDVQKALCEAVAFVSGDRVEFTFSASTLPLAMKQPALDIDLSAAGYRSADTIILLSGGLDSLAATLQARRDGRKPLLVSHRPASQLQARQENVLKLLRSKDPEWPYPHLSVQLHNVGERPIEFSQRSRSFLYAALAALAAKHVGVHDLRLCDNGVVTLNLPPSGQCVGTTLSRSTHPGYLRRLEPLLRMIDEDDGLTVSNTLLFHTKREVVELVATMGAPEWVQETVSCAHTERRSKLQPHCGKCTQCIDRRFATVAAGLEEHDLPERYEHEIFTHSLDVGRDRTHAENYLRFAHELASYADKPAAFWIERSGDLTDALPEDGIDAYVEKVHELFQRHQRDVYSVLKQKVKQYADELAHGALPDHCAVRMTAASDVRTPPRDRYMQHLGNLFARAIPIAFQSEPPKNEHEMQNVGEAVLKSADEKFEREAPQVPFGSVGVRPDFSQRTNSDDALYIEFKLVKKKTERNRISGEIAADVTQYPPKCSLLFVVFDPGRAFADPSKLKTAVEGRRDNARVVIFR